MAKINLGISKDLEAVWVRLTRYEQREITDDIRSHLRRKLLSQPLEGPQKARSREVVAEAIAATQQA